MASSASPAIASGLLTRHAWRARVAKHLTTTPGRIRLSMVAILIGLLLTAVAGAGAVRARQRAAGAVGQQAEPLMVGAEVIYSSLGDADATATNTFLKSGLEPPQRRQQYLDDLKTAAKQLAAVFRQAGGSTATSQSLDLITKDLPTYAGLVEAARANNRLGNPVGAAYLREGSTLMQTEILPAVRQLFQVEAGRLNQSSRSGQSVLHPLAVVVVAGLALVLLIAGQVFVARRTNRVLNPGLVLATLAVLVLLAWAVIAFSVSGSRLHQAQSGGSDPIQVLATTRILLSRAQSDENLALVARGSGSQYLADFDVVAAQLQAGNGTAGLIGQAAAAVPPGTDLYGLYQSYLKAHQAVVTAVNNGKFTEAVAVATGTGATDEVPAATQLTGALSAGIDSAQKIFDARAAAARHDLSLLGFGVLALAILAGGVAVAGLEQRINEYR